MCRSHVQLHNSYIRSVEEVPEPTKGRAEKRFAEDSAEDYFYTWAASEAAEGPRTGKWTRDEELFADALVEKFESGTLPDCEEGRTLRSYLAQKLNCIAMRISKKYGGKCIGSHLYCHTNVVETAEETERMQRLEEQSRVSIKIALAKRLKRKKFTTSHVSLGTVFSCSDCGESSSDHTDAEETQSKDELNLSPLLDECSEYADLIDEASISNNWSQIPDQCLLLS